MNQRSYWAELGLASDAGWRRFWFTPRDPRVVSILRIVAGISTIYFLLSFTGDLVAFFGPHGVLDRGAVARLVTDFGEENTYRFSLLQLTNDTSYLYFIHILSLLIAGAMTAGVFSRITTPLTLLAVLSYVHRAPMITGQLEPVLTMLLFYLSLAPTGRYYSFDAWWRNADEIRPSLLANISVRLIQLHLAGIYLLTGLSMLSGDIWWLGEGLLWLSGNRDSRLASISWAGRSQSGVYFVNVLSHLTVAFMLLYGVLIWKRLARPLLAAASIPVWTMLALLTGLVSYCALMVMLNAAFLDGRLDQNLELKK